VKYDEKTEVLTKRICIHKGKNLSYHYHSKRTEIWTITKGNGQFILDGKIESVNSGDVLRIPAQALHAIIAHTDLEFIEVQSGTELVEEDIIRISLEWEDIRINCETLVE
jgi:mannose-1-phosphate guanylyltransferase